MKNFLLLLICFCFLSCASDKFVRKAKHKESTQDLIEFKDYLLKNNVMDDFKESRPITGIKDPVILGFYNKYNVGSMHIWKCGEDNYDTPSSPFITCGDTIDLYYNGTHMISTIHAITFDYSSEPLELKASIDEEKHKITNRIYVF
ncbi:hypothetical protein LY01_02411 [Nonlabens xylanidelens]|uniref:Lipoprotein n=1 Tax=Nonlabens xylanidelens TaxID=191564 RepID=A0A2S6IHE5_9FLAO|nr:hypothetical protein [Nonlabens xylanidelens]PPK93628.1 hypothetical protein LY01_02411 [Nonlabens xylanidelens]PQJ17789.1 hypothetical protein BST94_12215 [Nonlabens xylanidelens]